MFPDAVRLVVDALVSTVCPDTVSAVADALVRVAVVAKSVAIVPTVVDELLKYA